MSFYNLPDHCILEVFKNLCAKDLVRVRSVCRNWAAIVSDSIDLRRKYSLYVSDRSNKYNLDTFIQTFTKSPYKICTNISFRDLYFYEERDSSEGMSESETESEREEKRKNIEILNRFWSKIGGHIESFRIELRSDLYNKSSQHNWLALLENTPNLINLEVKSGRYNTNFSESTKVTRDFNLAKLKTVAVRCWDYRLNLYLLNVMVKFANGLTSIELKGKTGIQFDTLYSLIVSQRHSLRELKLGRWIGKENLQKIFTIDNLSLEVFHLGSDFDEDTLKLLGNHKNLRDLKIQYSKSTENFQYPTYLPKLEKLELRIAQDYNKPKTPFLKNFNNLRSLTIGMNGIANNIIKFEALSFCPTLEILEINSLKVLKISPISIQTYINSYPNLKVLKLIKISCDARDVAAICSQLLHLEELELRMHSISAAIDRDAFSNISNLRKLKRLSVEDYIPLCDDKFFIEHLRLPSLISLSLSRPHYQSNAEKGTNQGISGLIDNCPLLEVLHLEKFDGITDASAEEIRKRLVHLQEFSISGKQISRKRKLKNK